MTVVTTQRARFRILELELPGRGPVNAGVLLEDCSEDRLHVRLRRDWDLIAPEEAEVLAEMESDLAGKSAEMGAGRLLAYLEDTLSNVMRGSSTAPSTASAAHTPSTGARNRTSQDSSASP